MKRPIQILILISINIFLLISCTNINNTYSEKIESEVKNEYENKAKTEENIVESIVIDEQQTKNEYNSEKFKYINYKEISNIEKKSLVVFTSEKCEYCVDFEAKLEYKYTGNTLDIYLVDMSKEYNKKAWEELNIKGIPYTLFIEDGVVKNSFLGLESFEELPSE